MMQNQRKFFNFPSRPPPNSFVALGNYVSITKSTKPQRSPRICCRLCTLKIYTMVQNPENSLKIFFLFSLTTFYNAQNRQHYQMHDALDEAGIVIIAEENK